MSVQVSRFGTANSKSPKAASRVEDAVGPGVDVFLQNFVILAQAQGGMKTLRSLVLDLAVQGRLTPQTFGARSEQEGTPFSCPAGWTWTPLGRLAVRCDYGTSQKADNTPPGVAVLRMNNIQAGRLDLSSLKYVPTGTEGISDLLLAAGDILFNRTNSFELVGKMAVFREPGRYTFASYLIRVRVGPDVLPEYINYYFGSSICRRSQIEPQITEQTNQANFNGTKLKGVFVPLPPLAEQKRIVAKVDRLMALCDDLEARQTKKREVGKRLTKSALEALTIAEGPEEFEAGWKRVVENFEVLFAHSELVPALAEHLVDLALTGKLSGDTSSWKRIRLGDAATVRTGFAFKSPDYAEEGTFVLRVTNISPDGKISRDSDAVFFPETKIDENIRKHFLRAGELLVVMVGGSLGKVGIVSEDVLPALLNQNMWRVNARPDVLSQRFLIHVLRYINRKKARVTQSTHGHLAMGEYVEEMLRLPSLEEQERLAQVIERLSRRCDDLGAKLRRAEDRAAKLVEAVVQELVVGDSTL